MHSKRGFFFLEKNADVSIHEIQNYLHEQDEMTRQVNGYRHAPYLSGIEVMILLN